uniref:NADH-ubiquinone oxidoreductase chain 6 n=1 Tax=Micrambina sp. MIC01 TaxID=1227472 RepID=S4SV62_9CUCU|nr:NADH dehydrogenase subunit 6 [Micrambina sp. MIC01]
MMIIYYLIILNSLIFIFLNHPLSMGTCLLIQTLFISLITGKMYLNFWFSYLLFLIMVGGMLILFMYMTSVASNEKFKFSIKLVLMLSILFTLMMTYLFYFNPTFFFMNEDMLNKSEIYFFNNTMAKFTEFPSYLMYYLIILYLLMTLIAVVKITKTNQGPIRQKF